MNEHDLTTESLPKMQQLPWDAPPSFRTVPTHRGIMCRGPVPGLEAQSDLDMVALWLAERASASTNTAMAYRKETERFLFWLADSGKVISDATREDFIRYAKFLIDPKPRHQWVADRKHPRTSPDWRPFTTALKPDSVKYSLSVIRAMLDFMHSNGWLAANPMPETRYLVATTKEEPALKVARRQLSEQQMGLLGEFVDRYEATEYPVRKERKKDQQPEDGRQPFIDRRNRVTRARLRLILALAGTLGARQADIIEGFLSDFSPAPSDLKAARWLWYIPNGKGRKAATLPVPDWVMDRVVDLRVTLGLPAYPSANEPPYPICPDTRYIRDSERPIPTHLPAISRSGLYRHMQDVFHRLAYAIDSGEMAGSSADARILRDASLHWLRHTAMKRITRKTKDLTIAKLLGRHASIETTALYAESSLSELADALYRD